MAAKTTSRLWRVLERYAGPYALSYQVGLVVLIPLSIGTAASDPERVPSAWQAWLIIGAESLVASLAVFLLLGLVFRRVPVGPWRSVLVALCFGLVEAGRAVLVEQLAYLSGFGAADLFGFRFFSGFTTGIALFGIASILVNDAYLYRREFYVLREQEGRLRQLLMRSTAEFAVIRAELLRGVRETVDEAIRAVLRPRKSRASAQEVVDTLINISESVIRPISHDLHDNPRRFPEEVVEPRRMRVRVRDVVELATTNRPYRPLVTSVLAVLLATPPLLYSLGVLIGSLATLELIGATMVFLGLGQLDARRRYDRLRIGTRAFLMSLTFVSFGASIGIVFSLINVWSDGLSWTSVTYVSLLGLLICWILVIPNGIQAARSKILDDTARVNRSLRWELARANALVWQEQQELSTALHRDIQGALLASAFRLKQVIESGGDTGAAMDEIQTILGDSVNLVPSDNGPDTLHLLFDDLTTRWEGVLHIEATYSGKTRAVIEGDRVVMRAIRDIAGEFATNAIKHGRARNMTVDLGVEKSHEVILTLTNDGRPREADAVPGLGTILIQNLATRVIDNVVAEGVSTTVSLPTGAVPRRVSATALMPVPSVD